MNLSNMISDAVLAGTAFWVFWRNFQWLSGYDRVLWGLFFLSIAMTALIGVIRFAGLTVVTPLHQSLEVLAGSLGVACAVVGVYSLVLKQSVSPRVFYLTAGVGLALFFALLLNPVAAEFRPVVRSFGMLVVMLTACFGLLRRSPSALWVVFAVMILALATKFVTNPDLPIDAVDFNHYTLALALICFGQAGRKAQPN